ncbi:transposase [Singulisphaera acidiphila]|uniref:transposase n=1 Tax=Singulisphaera acidiphila TaxID=466153 RepID=UPI0002471675|nr:transposase [Singulisphaera acidiphila]
MNAQGQVSKSRDAGYESEAAPAGADPLADRYDVCDRGRSQTGCDSVLFIKHLDELWQRLRRYKKIHVACDNASCHTSLEVIQSLWKWEGRIEVHLLPVYSPHLNPSCKRPGELLDPVFAWLGARNPFRIEGSIYPKAKAACHVF